MRLITASLLLVSLPLLAQEQPLPMSMLMEVGGYVFTYNLEKDLDGSSSISDIKLKKQYEVEELQIASGTTNGGVISANIQKHEVYYSAVPAYLCKKVVGGVLKAYEVVSAENPGVGDRYKIHPDLGAVERVTITENDFYDYIIKSVTCSSQNP